MFPMQVLLDHHGTRGWRVVANRPTTRRRESLNSVTSLPTPGLGLNTFILSTLMVEIPSIELCGWKLVISPGLWSILPGRAISLVLWGIVSVYPCYVPSTILFVTSYTPRPHTGLIYSLHLPVGQWAHYWKKRKFELGCQPANTRLGPKHIHFVCTHC